MDASILTDVGLSADEADIYQSLLDNGPQTATQLEKTTKVKRTYVYRICAELVKKGLVIQTKKDHTTIFSPQSPDHLLSLAQNQKQQAEQAQQSLKNVLSTLRDKYRVVETRPVVTYFEGIEGIKKVFADIYAPKKEPVYGCVDLEKADTAVPGYIVKELIPLRIKNKLFAKSFIAKSAQGIEIAKKDKESLRESVLLDKKKYPMPAEIDVFEDKIALLSFAKGQFVGVLIQNQDLATSIKSIFKLAFEKPRKKR
jgi:sugar-specific transcriptional regulator TrmB